MRLVRALLALALVAATAPGLSRLSASPQLSTVAAQRELFMTSGPVVLGSSAALSPVSSLQELVDASGLGDGAGITVAVIDSGINEHPDLAGRVAAHVRCLPVCVEVPAGAIHHFSYDAVGHGTFMAGLIAGDGTLSGGHFKGMAPRARLVDVRVADAQNRVSGLAALHAILWVVHNQERFGIDALNFSLSSAAVASYHADALAAALEVAWAAGIAVVTSAGNAASLALPGPKVGSPGIDPYVITVGASLLVSDGAGWQLSEATWSARGTAGGFLKPDVLAPGRSVVSTMVVAGNPTYVMSTGTSSSAAITSGAVALILQQRPGLKPDQLKSRIVRERDGRPVLLSVREAVKRSGTLANARLQPSALLPAVVEYYEHIHGDAPEGQVTAFTQRALHAQSEFDGAP